MDKSERKLPSGVRFGYGVGNLSFGVVLQLLTSYLMFYATNILGIPGRWVGLAASIGVIWDAISDPIMGHITDNFASARFGRRHLFMLVGAVGTTVLNLLLWTIDPQLGTLAKFFILAAILLLIRTFMTLYGVPYNALGAELTTDYFERTNVQSYKTAFFVLGMVFPTVGGTMLFFRSTQDYPIGQLNPGAYVYMAVVGSMIMAVAGIYCLVKTWPYRTFAKRAHTRFRPKRLALSFAVAFRNKNFRFIALGYLLINFASAWVGALALHTFTYTLNYTNNQMALVFGAMFGCAVLSQPFWLYLSKKLDKKPALLIAVGCGILGSVILLLMVLFALDFMRSAWASMLPMISIIGLGVGGMLSLPPSMVSDICDLQYAKSGRRMEGLLFGTFTLCYKLSQSIAVLVLGVLLDVIRFRSDLSQQAPSTIIWLGVLLPLGCLFAFGLGYLAYSRYSLTFGALSAVHEKIAEDR